MENKFSGNISKIVAFFVVLFLCLLIHLTYIQLFDEQLKFHHLNVPSGEKLVSFKRGTILDASGEKLAFSEKQENGSFIRLYPYGESLAHVVGYHSSKLGDTGAESTFSPTLTGQTEWKNAIGALTGLLKPQQGNDVYLTIHAKLQEVSYKALQGQKGAVIVLQPQTGAILAMASSPSFLPNEIDTNWNSIRLNQTSPLLNRASQGLYPPGSIIKPLFADEALKRNTLTKTETLHCAGTYFFNQQPVLNESSGTAHGDVNMKEALTVSCNVYFADLANQLQAEGMKQAFERFLLDENFESIESVSAFLPEFNTLKQSELAQIGIGQGSLLVTPLQMAVFVATFANQGIMMAPHLLKEMKTPNGDIIEKYKEKVLTKATTEARANFLRSCMENVIENGTGQRAWTEDLKIAGKTGTAENEREIPHAWFIGFAPADHPLFAIAVIVENGGSGGQIAAPIAKDILTYAFHEEVGQ